MASSARKGFVGRFGVHIAVFVFVAIWTIPTLGILMSSLRDKDQIIASGWWSSFVSSTQTEAGRLPPASAQVEKDGKFVIEGNIFGDAPARDISAFGIRSAAPTEFPAGHGCRPEGRRDAAGQRRRLVRHDIAEGVRRRPRAARLLCVLGAAALHHRELRDGAVFGRHRPLLHQLADGHRSRRRSSRS